MMLTKVLKFLGLNNFFASWKSIQKLKEHQEKNIEIVFYSETKNDYAFFKPIIEYLQKDHNKEITYITSDSSDPKLSEATPLFVPFFISDGMFLTILFKTIKCKVFVMTLPDLESFHLKKSVHSPHYVYIFHNMLSSHMVFRENAFNAYDTIFCVGPHHEKEIRKTEKLYNLKRKNLIPHGYSKLDAMLEENKLSTKNTEEDPATVLLATSWGVNSISNLCLEELLDSLIDQNINLIFRPHPMTLKQNPELIESVKLRYKDYNNFKLDLDISTTQSLTDSDIMISGWSGVALEYCFGLEKPVIFIDVPKKINNPKYQDLEILPFEVSIRNKIGEVVDINQLKTLPDVVSRLLADPNKFNQKIAKIREQSIFNIGKSAFIASENIIKINENNI